MVSELWLQHFPEWAMKDQIAEASFLLPNKDQKIVTGKFTKNSLRAKFVGSSENLVRSSFDAAEELV